MILQNDHSLHPTAGLSLWTGWQQWRNTAPEQYSATLIFLSSFFFSNMHLLLLKRLKDFFQSKLSGLSENRTFLKANFPWCSGNIITPKHHSFSMTYGFIYKKQTSLTPINKKYSHKLECKCQFEQHILKLASILKNKFDTNKCHVRVSVSASLSVWPIL